MKSAVLLSFLAAAAPALANVTTDYALNSHPPGLVVIGPGASFGTGGVTFTGATNAERTYLQTLETDLFTRDFVAELTLTLESNVSIAFFGMGNANNLNGTYEPAAGNILLRMHSTPLAEGAFGVADRNVPVGETSATLGNIGSGTHRVRLTWDAAQQTARFEIDAHYAGGAFTADYSSSTISGADNGFTPTNTAVYFGSNNGNVVSGFSITAIPEPSAYGLLGAGTTLAIVARRRRRQSSR